MSFWERWGIQAESDAGDGLEWILGKRGGFGSEEVVKAQVGMLERCRIQGFLPFRLESAEGIVSFRYRVEGLRSVTAAARDGLLTERRIEGLLIAIASALREGERYLIDGSDVVLHPDWIWVSRDDVRNVRLMAVPLRTYASPAEGWRQWKALYNVLAQCGLPGRWRDALNPSRWDADTFSHRLWAVELEEEGPRETADDKQDSSVEGRLSKSPEAAFETSGFHEAEDGETMYFSAARVRREELLRLGLAVIGWSCFAYFASLLWLMLALLLSVPLGGTLWKRYRDDGETAVAVASNAADEAGAPGIPSVEASDPVPIAERTTLLGVPERTVWLRDIQHREGVRVKLIVQIEGTDRIETVDIGNGPLRIGRGPVGVDFVVDHAAASRVHLAIERQGAEYFATDVGSTNGTYLNDASMVPNEKYALHHEDRLRLPGVSLCFEKEDI
ncbi:FHA domain-containing protein [Paenibacillus sp. TRM 82003]|nr:FHA domain-containing protein [Paenibacillus sp. TRM 82003]